MTALTTERHITREKVLAFEHELAKLPQMELPVKHWFAPGIYARELFIPAGTCLTGKIHRHAHLNIISQGVISVLTEHGMKVIEAPCTLISSSGIKRVGYAHTDTIWTCVHSNPGDETDLEKLEALFIAPNFEAIEGPVLEDKLCLGQQ